MEVIVEGYVDIDELDLTAGLFWEMTYYLFDYKDKLVDSSGQVLGHIFGIALQPTDVSLLFHCFHRFYCFSAAKIIVF